MSWWVWTLFGLFLLILEVFSPGGFYIMFFGIGGILVGTVVGVGWVATPWVEWLLFSVVSLTTLAVLRRPIVKHLTPTGDRGRVDSFVGEIAVALADLPAGEIGQAELRGSTWSARNVGTVAVARGQRCRVERVEGLTIFLRPE
jgi:membrane protein implicated in regulation of membrane protease activity